MMISDMGTNVISEQLKDFCKKLDTEKASSSCIKFVKYNADVNLALLQIRSMPVGLRFQSPATFYSTGPLEV